LEPVDPNAPAYTPEQVRREREMRGERFYHER
jgi:hypothetical protein